MTRCASQCLGLMSSLKDLGQTVEATVSSDSSSALAITHRRGLGKLRHIQVQYLWLQGAVRENRIQVHKISGALNPADLFTKHLAAHLRDRHLDGLSCAFRGGRHDLAPQVASGMEYDAIATLS